MASSFVILWTVVHQAPLSMGFSRQEYWSGLPFPSPGYLPDPGIEPLSLALTSSFFITSTWEAPWTFNVSQLLYFFYLSYIESSFCHLQPKTL